MSQASSPAWTVDGFLAWEAAQPDRWEFDGFAPVAMTGGTYAHEVVQGNAIRAFNNRLAGTPCRAVGANFKVQTASGIRYPDVVVICTPMAPNALVCRDPAVIVEVASPSTATDDRTTKLAEYRALPSLQHYILLEQDRVFATVIALAGTTWTHTLLGLGGMLELPGIGVTVPVAELYEGLSFDLPPGAPSP